MYKIFLKNSGQSILELVIALGVFLIIITVFTDFIYGNFVLLERGSDYVQAEAIAKEEIEAIRSIKKMTWNEFLYSTSSVSVLNNRWVLNGEGVIGNVGKFFYSSSFNPENNSSFVTIFWTENIPLGCDIKIQIKTAPDAGGIPGIWSATWSGPDGEDGNETDYYTVQSGQIINVDHNNDQWIKYKVLLTSDSINTPVLSEVSFYYQQ